LSCETGRIPRCRSRSVEEKATPAPAQIGLQGKDLAQSETPCTWRRPLCGTWEISSMPVPGSGRLGKATSRTPSMHVGEKSDGAIVPGKRPNNGGQPPAEVVEGRAPTKGNSRQAAATRTQSRTAASIGMADVRRRWRRHRRRPPDVRPEVGARCVSSARRDLRGGR
jgi:hypothetical protein